MPISGKHQSIVGKVLKNREKDRVKKMIIIINNKTVNNQPITFLFRVLLV